MGRPKLYITPEERLTAERRWRANASIQTKANRAAYIASPGAQGLAKVRYARYRETEKYRAAQKRYAASQLGKATESAYQAWQRVIHPIRIKARAAVASALRKGLIERPTSCRCGRQTHLDAHHTFGYEPKRWLDVEWLCRKCHKTTHAS